jgi:hypothetical protein
MLAKFGIPGNLSDQCSAVSGPVAARIRYGVNVGPFKVSGLDYAVESLSQVFATLSDQHADVFTQVKTAGMLCVRRIKNNPAHYSNHSWGTAIDLYFGSGVVPQGKTVTQRGFLSLYEVFNEHGWYWGAGFSGGSVDTMHFELAEETIKLQLDEPLSQRLIMPAADYILAMGYENVVEPTAGPAGSVV